MNQYSHNTIKENSIIEFPSTRNIELFSHTIFNRYPARSICLVPRSILLDKKSKVGALNILDPFMGSGTTAVEAGLCGHQIFGVEMDDFAKMIAEVKVNGFSERELSFLFKKYKEISFNWREFTDDYNLAPKVKNIEYWFTDQIFKDLLKIKNAIYTTNKTEQYLKFFKVVLADMLRPCSLAERQSLKPFISKKHLKVPLDVGRSFEKSFEKHFSGIRDYSKYVEGKKSKISWLGDNAVNFNVPNKQIDIAITSPPYINALDYVRCIKIESSWVDCSSDEKLTHLKKIQVGGSGYKESVRDLLRRADINSINKVQSLDNSRAQIIDGYFWSMQKNLNNVYDSLKNGGSYTVIVGNSVIRKIEINTARVIEDLAIQSGFKVQKKYKYIIKDHRLSIPRMGEGGKIEYEYVTTFVKA